MKNNINQMARVIKMAQMTNSRINQTANMVNNKTQMANMLNNKAQSMLCQTKFYTSNKQTIDFLMRLKGIK